MNLEVEVFSAVVSLLLTNRPRLRTPPPPHSYGNQRLQRQFNRLLMMGIEMPETCWAVSVRQSNKILWLIVASSWVFYLSDWRCTELQTLNALLYYTHGLLFFSCHISLIDLFQVWHFILELLLLLLETQQTDFDLDRVGMVHISALARLKSILWVCHCTLN
jgi:hypothetical protein